MELKELLGLFDSYGLNYKVGGNPEKVKKFVEKIEDKFINDGITELDYDLKLNDNLNLFNYDREFKKDYSSNSVGALCA